MRLGEMLGVAAIGLLAVSGASSACEAINKFGNNATEVGGDGGIRIEPSRVVDGSGFKLYPCDALGIKIPGPLRSTARESVKWVGKFEARECEVIAGPFVATKVQAAGGNLEEVRRLLLQNEGVDELGPDGSAQVKIGHRVDGVKIVEVDLDGKHFVYAIRGLGLNLDSKIADQWREIMDRGIIPISSNFSK